MDGRERQASVDVEVQDTVPHGCIVVSDPSPIANVIVAVMSEVPKLTPDRVCVRACVRACVHVGVMSMMSKLMPV